MVWALMSGKVNPNLANSLLALIALALIALWTLTLTVALRNPKHQAQRADPGTCQAVVAVASMVSFAASIGPVFWGAGASVWMPLLGGSLLGVVVCCCAPLPWVGVNSTWEESGFLLFFTISLGSLATSVGLVSLGAEASRWVPYVVVGFVGVVVFGVKCHEPDSGEQFQFRRASFVAICFISFAMYLAMRSLGAEVSLWTPCILAALLGEVVSCVRRCLQRSNSRDKFGIAVVLGISFLSLATSIGLVFAGAEASLWIPYFFVGLLWTGVVWVKRPDDEHAEVERFQGIVSGVSYISLFMDVALGSSGADLTLRMPFAPAGLLGIVASQLVEHFPEERNIWKKLGLASCYILLWLGCLTIGGVVSVALQVALR